MRSLQPKMKRKMIRLTISFSLFVMVGGVFGVTYAADGVNMQVQVLERKSTDAFNGAAPEPQVLGASIDTKQMCLRGESDIKPVPVWQRVLHIFHL